LKRELESSRILLNQVTAKKLKLESLKLVSESSSLSLLVDQDLLKNKINQLLFDD
jgi:hypothetical protein